MSEEARGVEMVRLLTGDGARKFTLLEVGRWQTPRGKSYRCQVYLSREPEGGFSILAASLPGVASQGDTEAEALRNIVDAFEIVLATYKGDGQEIPWLPAPREPALGGVERWVIVNG